MNKFKNLITLILLTFIFAFTAKADSWSLPQEKTICSENNKFCFKVIPKKLGSQLDYFKDKVDGKENAGADKKAKENYCKGIFYVRDEKGNLREQWKTKLVNEVSPVNVLVSNQGDYVVTFDNWHGVGYGDDVVVIYDASKGSLIRSFGLSEFLTDSDIESLPTSTSSIWWGGNHWIDKEKGQLVLQVTKGKKSFENNADYFEIGVELSTGKILDEKRDRLPSLQFLIEPIEANQEQDVSQPSKDDCVVGIEVRRIVSSEFLAKAISKEKPVYGAAAKAVRATGKLVAEILVAENGDVNCARIISGHPLLRNSILEAVKKWKFEKSEGKYIGRIAFDAKSVLVSPEGKIIE